MTDRFVFVTGMFRSGTTLLARMLNAHPQIALASDPYAPLFKAFRNAVAEQVFNLEDVDHDAPLDDYYFYPEKQKLMVQIQETPLNFPLGNMQLPELQEQIAKASRPFSPKIEPFLSNLQGKTFADLLASGLDIIKGAYGNADTQLLGFKEVWTDEFAGHILQQFPEAKIIHIIRDPRAVCASKNVASAKYPWIFLTRQWRKLATSAWVNHHRPTYNDRVLMMSFEELVTNPLQQAQRMCKFLEIEFHENLVAPTSFISGDGTPWHQNSSHFEGKQQFNPKSVDRWQQVLTSTQVEFIESMCLAEMREFGYQPTVLENLQTLLSLVFKPLEVAVDELADWILPYSTTNTAALTREMALEYLRSSVMTGEESVSNDEKRLLCLNEAFFDVARALCQNRRESQ